MKEKINKTNENLTLSRARLDQIQMSAHERLIAEAQLARAEAAVEALGALFALGRRLVKTLVVRPFRRTTTSAG